MVEVRVEIMGYSLDSDLQSRRIQFKLRTPWRRGVSHDFKNKNVTLVVTQEEFDNHKIVHLGDRTDMLLFLELWNFEDDLNRSFHEDNSVLGNSPQAIMAGLVRCNLNDQLRDENLSPSIQWLDIYDPIRNSDRGKILIRVFTTFVNFRNRRVADDANPTSTKFNLSPPERGVQTATGYGPPQSLQIPESISSIPSQPDGTNISNAIQMNDRSMFRISDPAIDTHNNSGTTATVTSSRSGKSSSKRPPQSQQLRIPDSILSIPSQSDGTNFSNAIRKGGRSMFRTTGPEIDTDNNTATTAVVTSSRSGTSSGSSARSRRIAADIYHD